MTGNSEQYFKCYTIQIKLGISKPRLFFLVLDTLLNKYLKILFACYGILFVFKDNMSIIFRNAVFVMILMRLYLCCYYVTTYFQKQYCLLFVYLHQLTRLSDDIIYFEMVTAILVVIFDLFTCIKQNTRFEKRISTMFFLLVFFYLWLYFLYYVCL